jgi:hypothetical protein
MITTTIFVVDFSQICFSFPHISGASVLSHVFMEQPSGVSG